MKLVAYFERPASVDPDEFSREVFSADRVWRDHGANAVIVGWEVGWSATLAHNLAVAGFGAAMFRAGDNFGFHMGEDSSQCTCQWSPGRGVPYVGSQRCEHERYDDDFYDQEPDDPDELDDYDPEGEWPDNLAAAGPNGCTCGFNGDCNCPFVEST